MFRIIKIRNSDEKKFQNLTKYIRTKKFICKTFIDRIVYFNRTILGGIFIHITRIYVSYNNLVISVTNLNYTYYRALIRN